VRGVCCLRPGIPGLSENISVRSIVDRFLEHSRVCYFENALQPEVYVGSADWMPRNFFKRIEVVFPIEDGNLIDRLKNELLELQLADNTKARILQPDGSYLVPKPATKAPLRRSQTEFIELALDGKKGSTALAGRPAKREMKVRRKP
jgi:polyphosphate kinase